MSCSGFDAFERCDLRIEGPEALKEQNLLSPFVWRTEDDLYLLLRAQPKRGKISGTIWLGRSSDGLCFNMDDQPLIAPSLPRLDESGCEDPTVVLHNGSTYVFYTGVDSKHRGELLYAVGRDIHHLDKQGIAFHCSRTELNTKEASVRIGDGGSWHLFHEYSHDNRSLIGLAVGHTPSGPWRERADPIRPRKSSWDSYHLSTGPLIDRGEGDLLMFYNGSNRDPVWSIGWATFDRTTLRQTGRCKEPLISPPPSDKKPPRITFAASALVQPSGDIHLYYSRDDEVPRRATIRPR